MARARSLRRVVLLMMMAALIFSTLMLWSYIRYPYSLHADISKYPYRFGGRQAAAEDIVDDILSHADRNTTPSIYDISLRDNSANFECIRTITRPSATVCLFNIWRDVFISRSLQSARIWEPHVVYEYIEAVERSDATAGVVDVGANIGYYTLLAAKLGRQVVAVEPLLDSIKRLHHAAQIDGTAGNIRVVHNAVAEVRTRATLRPNGDNQGDARIQLSVEDCSGSCPLTIDTIILDDLTDVVPFRQAVMKIDIQGYEHHAFQRASRLFNAVHFTHIFMEWMVMRDFFVAANHSSTDKQLVERMLRFLFQQDYRPYDLVYYGGRPLDPDDWGSWPLDIVWHRLPNSDEQSRIDRNHFKNWPR